MLGAHGHRRLALSSGRVRALATQAIATLGRNGRRIFAATPRRWRFWDAVLKTFFE